MSEEEATGTSAAGRHMRAEIAEQPEIFARLLANRRMVEEVAEQIRRHQPRFALLAARGSSDHAALYAKYLIEVLLELPAGLVSPSTTTLYGARPDLSDVLLLSISQSGGSPDLVEVTETARRLGATTVAITNVEESPLNSAAELPVHVHAGSEWAVAATKTYTATLLTLYLLVDAVRGGPGDAANAVPELADVALESSADAVTGAVERYRSTERMVTTGRGYSAASAAEAALKLAETCYLAARSYSGADLLHGPIAALDPETAVLAFCGAGKGGAAMREAFEAVRERGADICAIGSAAQSVHAAHHISVPECAEELGPVLEVLPVQRLALELALARHENPDHPRGLHKVTRTR